MATIAKTLTVYELKEMLKSMPESALVMFSDEQSNLNLHTSAIPVTDIELKRVIFSSLYDLPIVCDSTTSEIEEDEETFIQEVLIIS